MVNPRVVGFVVALLTGASTVTAQTWFFSGPGGAPINVAAIDPFTPETVFAGTDAGLFKSMDGGVNWRGVLYGSRVNAIVMDTITPATLYIGTHSDVLKSTDGGGTWRQVATSGISHMAIDPSSPATVYAAGLRGLLLKTTDGGEHWTSITNGLDRTVTSLVIDPWRPWILYAGTSSSGMFKTHDAGASWYAVPEGLPEGLGGIRSIAIDFWNPDTVYFADSRDSSSAIYVTANGGWPWEVASLPPPTSVAALAIDPLYPFVLYAGSSVDGMYRSLDYGRTWAPINSGLSSRRVSTLVIDSSNPSTLYAGTTDQGMFKSTDRGATWFAISSGLFGLPITSIAADRWSSAVYAAGAGGLYKSPNYGFSWESLTGGIVLATEAASSSVGHDVSLNSVVIDTWSPSTLYVATNFRDVLKTTDGGATWISTITPSQFYSPMSEIVLDAFQPGTAYAGGAFDLLKSVDGAAHWSPTAYPVAVSPHHAVHALAMNPQDSNILYGIRSQVLACYPSCTRTATSLLVTIDAGASWFSLDAGVTTAGEGGRGDIAIDPGNPANIYVTFGTATVWRSADGGLTWNSVTTGLSGSGGVSTLAVDLHHPGTVYAGGSGSVFKSVDGGQSWTSINAGLLGRPVYTVEVHPSIPGLVYAGTDLGVFVLYQP